MQKWYPYSIFFVFFFNASIKAPRSSTTIISLLPGKRSTLLNEPANTSLATLVRVLFEYSSMDTTERYRWIRPDFSCPDQSLCPRVYEGSYYCICLSAGGTGIVLNDLLSQPAISIFQITSLLLFPGPRQWFHTNYLYSPKVKLIFNSFLANKKKPPLKSAGGLFLPMKIIPTVFNYFLLNCIQVPWNATFSIAYRNATESRIITACKRFFDSQLFPGSGSYL